jgi:hypothetical protein
MSTHDLIVDADLVHKNDNRYIVFMQKIKQYKIEHKINILVYKNNAYSMKFSNYPALISNGSQYSGFTNIIKYLNMLCQNTKVDVMPKNYDEYLFKNIMNGKKYEDEDQFGEGLTSDEIKSIAERELSKRKTRPSNTKKYTSEEEMDDDLGSQMKNNENHYNLKSGDFDLNVWRKSIDATRRNNAIDDEDIAAMNNMFRGVGTTQTRSDVRTMFS